MNCNETRRWFDAHLDGELDVARDAELLEHVRDCADCAARLEARRAMHASTVRFAPRFTPPAGLETRIRAELRSRRTEPRRLTWQAAWRWLGVTGAVAAAACVGFFLGGGYAREQLRAGDLISAHVMALNSAHLTDVVSSDRHTVKPWLAEHLDYSPPVADLAAVGFPLTGARVERVGGRRVAALVYQRAKHVITTYVAPAEVAHFPTAVSDRGYHVRSWREGDFAFAAVSDVADADFIEFVERLTAATRQPTGGER